MDRHPPAMFVGDALGLDFLNSIATPVDTPVDWIEDGEGYLRWLEQARLVPRDVLEEMRTRALPGELDRVADQARSLREWFRGFLRRHKGRPLAAEALAELSRSIVCSSATRRTAGSPLGQPGEGPSSFRPCAGGGTPTRFCCRVVEALARLVCTEDFSQVKACEGPACTLLFADHTWGHARRRCSMAVCGNRASRQPTDIDSRSVDIGTRGCGLPSARSPSERSPSRPLAFSGSRSTSSSSAAGRSVPEGDRDLSRQPA